MRNQMSNDGLLGKMKDPEMIELNFRAQTSVGWVASVK